MIAKLAIPVALLAAFARADDCSFDSATTVTNGDGVSKLAACTGEIKGDIVIAQGAANPAVTLASPTKISGKLTIQNDPTISGFFAPMLKEITGAMVLQNCSQMGNIDLQSLQKSGDVTLKDLGALSMVTTGRQYDSAGNITIGNTQLTELGGFGNLSKVTGLDLNGNNLLSDVTMDIGEVGTISIGYNEVSNQGLSVRFDNLTTAQMINVQKAARVSFNSLQNVQTNFQLLNGTFESFSAPNLSWVGGMYIKNNDKMSNLSLPQLTAVNGSDSAAFVISNNTALKTIGGFPQLQTIKGALNWAGSFTNATDLGSLKVITGAVNVKSTEDITDVCNTFKDFKSKQVIRVDKYSCSGKAPSAATGGPGGQNGGGGSGASGSSAAGHVDIPSLPTLSAGLGAFVLQFLLSF